MTKAQIDDAIRQVQSHARMLEEQFIAGVAEYSMLSVREALYTLGYVEASADVVIREIAARGFSYCLDPIVESSSYPDFVPTRPPRSACVWGIDQLRSRMDGV